MELFRSVLQRHNVELKREKLTTLQINIGKRCNQSCRHCHVGAGPARSENMESKTVERILELLAKEPLIETVDITGGAPELNPNFRRLVTAARAMGKEVIDRCNLSVLFEDGQQGTAAFLANERVQVVASMPCYLEENVDAQRGVDVFSRSIAGLQKLNSLGYGRHGTGLLLNLVYNPVGAHLPPVQTSLETDYRVHLGKYGIEFNTLYTITNMPIERYARELEKNNGVQEYQRLLVNSFNPQAALNVMCKAQLSIGWDGQIYDCDFNQMLDIPLNHKRSDIWGVERFNALEPGIAVAEHCFGCTAGSGSSCGGALL